LTVSIFAWRASIYQPVDQTSQVFGLHVTSLGLEPTTAEYESELTEERRHGASTLLPE
jgi:hypothetical protein